VRLAERYRSASEAATSRLFEAPRHTRVPRPRRTRSARGRFVSTQRVRVFGAADAARWLASRTTDDGSAVWAGESVESLLRIAEGLLRVRQLQREAWIAEGGREA